MTGLRYKNHPHAFPFSGGVAPIQCHPSDPITRANAADDASCIDPCRRAKLLTAHYHGRGSVDGRARAYDAGRYCIRCV